MAGRVVLANAFSPNMLPLEPGEAAVLCVRRLGLRGFVYWVEKARVDGLLDCAVGHASTARLVEELLGLPEGVLECSRKTVRLERGDSAVVVQLGFRLQEGQVLGYDELRKLMEEGRLGFYAVYYGPC